ncbi:uncharacterized protein DS421_10g300820 [Arachis hypogaea]|nr:uncharacterized protein DS421_10g300820 [Arachis hypogaea]
MTHTETYLSHSQPHHRTRRPATVASAASPPPPPSRATAGLEPPLSRLTTVQLRPFCRASHHYQVCRHHRGPVERATRESGSPLRRDEAVFHAVVATDPQPPPRRAPPP